MKTIYSLLAIFAFIFFPSCMAEHPGELFPNGEFCIVSGLLTDNNGQPLERIGITVKIEGTSRQETWYSSSDGIFKFEIPYIAIEGKMTFTVSFNDLDGEENGGLFESKTDKITIYEEDHDTFPILIDLTPYRLTLATASESSPQS